MDDRGIKLLLRIRSVCFGHIHVRLASVSINALRSVRLDQPKGIQAAALGGLADVGALFVAGSHYRVIRFHRRTHLRGGGCNAPLVSGDGRMLA